MNIRFAAAVLLGFLACSAASFAQDISQQVVPGRENAPGQYNKPYVILISADGFRYDLAEKYHAETLLKLANSQKENRPS